MQIIDLKPSVLILHVVKLRGGISYKVLDRSEEITGKAEKAEWRTERNIFDKEEFDRGRALRAKIETLLRSATSAARSEIGLFAPDTPDIYEIIKTAEREINELIDGFHSTAFYNRLSSRVITFRIQSDNAQALEAISDQIQNGLEDLKEATKGADVKKIRAALKDLKGFDKLLPDAKSAELQKLVNDMRGRARTLNKLINKQGKKLDDSEIKKLMDISAVDTAELVIFDAESEPENESTLSTFEASDFFIDNEPPPPAPELEEVTAPAPAVIAEDFTPIEIEAPEAKKAPSAAPAPAPAPELEPDVTAEHTDGDDWTPEDTTGEEIKEARRLEL